ncbi:restin homolog isoform X2 [Sitodiplosis mosellana]|uniref:restin homolog isoform X2 n=1 Tax=Sitodiplosis mosellana TaxID=263140 RepID=UPI002443AC8E|nr:restin homolog isoform X2 [Sitodiplosis mosellana]
MSLKVVRHRRNYIYSRIAFDLILQDELNSEEMVSEWKTPCSSEFGSLETNCVKRLEFKETEEITNRIVDLDLGTNNNNGHGDGNDSGVDAGATNIIQLQRALSNNSAGYASSSGGLDAQFASCNSSLLSVCSDAHDDKTTVLSCKRGIDCMSENGSESSSLSGDRQQRLRQTPAKKRIGLAVEANQPKSPWNTDGTSKNRVRAASANRVMSHRTYGAPILATSERARSRDRQISSNSQSSPTKRLRPNLSLPTSVKDGSPLQQKPSTLRRSSSAARRTTHQITPISTPTTDQRKMVASTEDGRWPFRSAVKVQSRNTNETLIIKTKVGPMCLTTPRRKKVKSEEDLSEWQSNRRSVDPIARDRMSSSTIVRRQSTRESPNKGQFPPRYQKPTSKTLIYHEASIQTALTSQDNAFCGNAKEVQIDAAIKIHRESQVDIRDTEIEKLEEKLEAMDADNKKLRQNLLERSQLLTSMESQLNREREEKAAMKKELQSSTARVLGMLELVNATPNTESSTSCDSLLMLESRIQLSGHALEEKQIEINTLRHLCNQLQVEMNRSIQGQQNLLEERKCFEKESSELQDFLQDEKAAICEALRDAENEIEKYDEKLKQKDQEVERLQDECRHLVRISEQRRQEFLGMQTKYIALESTSKILVAQQSYVSGATLALSDLGSRLIDLVGQLVASYNISEQDLEDIVYHNEAYANSEESTLDNENKPINDESTSTQRFQSFITAVLIAIKNTASTAKDQVNQPVIKLKSISHESTDGAEMLDSETEPCLMMEDVSKPDSHTQNLISSCSLGDNQEDSLQMLCEAIANRQKIEEQTTMMLLNQSMHSETDISDSEAIPVQSLVDHVINVDNLVTKLLKVLRIIQIDYINEKNTFQLNKTMENSKLNKNLKNKKNIDLDHIHTDERTEINTQNIPNTANYSINDDTRSNGIELNLNSQNCAGEKCQNDTIAKAIETLNGIQSIVRVCPALIDLQRDLEQMLPSDCNANSQFE